MRISDIKPWGKAPNPLLPMFIRKKLGRRNAPKSLCQLAGENIKLSELDSSLWMKIDSVDRNTRIELVNAIRPHIRKIPNAPIWKKAISEEQLKSLPFSPRTISIVFSNIKALQKESANFREILMLPKCGVSSAIEIACLAETYNESNIEYEEEHEKKIEVAVEATELEVPNLVRSHLGRLDSRLKTIAEERIFKTGKITVLEILGRKFDGITRERVRQVERKVYDMLEFAKSNVEMKPVLERTHWLSTEIGSAIPVKKKRLVTKLLDKITEDFEFKNKDEKKLIHGYLLWCAGPYKEKNGWLINQNVKLNSSLKKLLSGTDYRGLVTHEVVEVVLNELDIKSEHHNDWIQHLKVFRGFQEGYILYKGSIIEKAVSYLNYRQAPVQVKELAEYVGSTSIRSACQRFVSSGKLWRININNEFVVAGNENYKPYNGITAEIINSIEENGGEASIDEIIDDFTTSFGVKKNSVIGFLGAPIFERTDGMVSLRQTVDDVISSSDVLKSVSCYKGGTDTWVWKLQVNKDTLRGSGKQISNGLALHVGCQLGDKINVPTEFGGVTFSWPIHTPYGASIGSLRLPALGLGAQVGDYLFVQSKRGNLSFKLLPKSKLEKEKVKMKKAAMLMGADGVKNKSEALNFIAKALAIRAKKPEKIIEQAKSLLVTRHESTLAEMIH